MHKLVPTWVLLVAALAACGDDGGNSESTGSSTTEGPVATSEPAASDPGTSGSDLDTFCQEYRSAQATAENPASTDQFRDLTPPDELADLWQDYLDDDWDAGNTVNGFIADNCF